MTLVLNASQDALVHALWCGGWDLRTFEVDALNKTARIEICRHDGLLVTFDARNGRSTITREATDIDAGAVGRRGDRYRYERVSMRFLGRQKCDDVHSGIRALCDYIVDNAAKPMLVSTVLPILASHVK